jgi:hypothetical protein
MKPRKIVMLCLGIGIIIAVSLIAFNEIEASKSPPIQPTLAPTLRPEEPEGDPASTSPPLAQPLESEEQVIEQVLYYDSVWATWETPWSIETVLSDPQRLTIERYESRSAEGAASAYPEWYSPEIEADAGLVWAVTIKGHVQVAVIGGEAGMTYDGVTYVISSRTGNLLGIRTGLPLLDK